MPTISRLSMDGGQASLCPPYEPLPSRQWLRQNHLSGKSAKPVESLAQKYSAFVLTQITGITPPVSRQMRGARERHECAVRCDGRKSCD